MRPLQEKFHELQESLRVTLASIGDAVITTDTQGLVTFLNPMAERLTGWTQQEAAGQPLETVFRIINEESREAVASPAPRVLREGLIVGLANHTVLIAKDGLERPIDDSAAPLRNPEGNVSGVVLVFRDITQRRAQERSLKESEERFRLLVGNVIDYAIFMLDPQGNVASWNAGAERIKGYSADEIIGTHFSKFYPAEVAASGFPESELTTAVREGRYEDEGWRIRKDGSRFWANVVITALRDETGTLRGFAKVTRDLTERKAAEDKNRQQQAELQRSEERFRLMIECVMDYAIFMLDPRGFVMSWNSGAQRIKGYAADEIIGTHFSRFYPPEIVAEGFPERELEIASKEGRFEDEGWRVRKDGSKFWANVVITAVRDEARHLLGFSKVTRDLTERRQLEKVRVEAEVLADVNRRKDEFLAMLSHELRNPLAPISNAVQLLRLDPSNDIARQPAISILERQVAHLTRLVDDLLEVSRISSGRIRMQRDDIDLRQIAERAVEAVHQLSAKRGHDLSLSLPADPVWVYADAIRIEQVIVNLLTNAAKYTNSGGKIRLSVEQLENQAVLRVADTGVGIAADLLPAVFDLFTQSERSLDRSEGGLGIGLTIVRKIVELHEGTVEAFSEGQGRGSEFVVTLPLAKPAGRQRHTPQTPNHAHPGALRLLVVDDNKDAANSVGMLLQTMGFDVRIDYSGSAAIESAIEFQPHAVFLDIGMPGMDGYEVARRFRQHPQLKDIRLAALTGYGHDSDHHKSQQAGFDIHLIKPIDSSVIREFLAGVASRDK
jgi:PAS domain S-box-containing protein